MIGLPRHHQKDRVAAPIGVDLSRLDQRFHDAGRETPLLGEILTHALEVGEIRHRQAWARFSISVAASERWRRGSRGRRRGGSIACKMLLEPAHRRLNVPATQVHH